MRTVEEVSTPDLDLEAMQAVLEDAPVAVAVLHGSYDRCEAAADGDVEVAVGLEETLSGLDRVAARVDLADELDRVADSNGTDVIPLSTASGVLLWELREDGVLLVGSESDLDRYGTPEPPRSHEERMAEFDEILEDLERLV